MTTAAQDEFNNLVASNNTRLTSHPEDQFLSDTESSKFTQSSSTLVESSPNRSARPSKTSLRGSKYDGRDSSDEDSDRENRARQRKSTPYYIPNHHGYNENTGPKGVIADARAFEREKRNRSKHTYVRTEGMVLPKMQHLQDNQHERSNYDRGRSSDEELDDEDDDFMQTWREKRGEELKSRTGHNMHPGRRKGRYGTMKAVDALGFLDAVEKSPRNTVVLVYVYDEEVRCHACVATIHTTCLLSLTVHCSQL